MFKLGRNLFSVLVVGLLLMATLLIQVPQAMAVTSDQLQDCLTGMQNLSKLSQSQALEAIAIVEEVVVNNNSSWLSASEIEKLKAKGLTKIEVQQAIKAVRDAIDGTGNDWVNLTSSDSGTQLAAAATLINNVEAQLGTTFINNLKDKGITTTDLISAVVELVNVQISSWSNLPKSAIETIFDNYADNAGLSQATVAAYGLNWANVQEILDSLDSTQRDKLEDILITIGNGEFDETIIVDPDVPITDIPEGVTQLQTTPINGVATLPSIDVSIGDIALTIPAGTKVTGPAGWDGVIQLPTVLANNSVTLTNNGTVSVVIELGSPNFRLKFNKAVKLVLPGQTGKSASYMIGGTITEITNVLSDDSQVVGDALAPDTEGKFDKSPNMIIWTKHFTKFIAYTPATTSGGGGGGGGGSSPVSIKVGDIAADSVVLQLSSTYNVESFDVYVNNDSNPVNSTGIEAVNNKAEYTVSGLKPSTSYKFKTKAKRTSGTYTSYSASVTVTTLAESEKTILPDEVSFKDVSDTHWAYKEIQDMAQKGYIHGIGNDLFAPDNKITRAEFTTILVNVLTLQDTGDLPFSDVVAGDWFYTNVAKAYKAGLVRGLSSDQFAPNAPITREQMAVLIANVLKYKDINVDVATDALAKFNDKDTISAWANSSAAVVAQKGIINGKSGADGVVIFAPVDQTTRAEATVMLKRMLDGLN